MSIEQPVDQNDFDLDYVRGIRKQIITEQMSKGVPTDVETLSITAKLLSDMSKDALSKKRLKQEEGVQGAAQAAISILAEVFKRSDARTLGEDTRTKRAEVPTLPASEITFDPTEMSPVGSTLDYNTFMGVNNNETE